MARDRGSRGLLADEPVASLDPQAAEGVVQLLRELAAGDRLAVLCVLHQTVLALRYTDRIVGLRASWAGRAADCIR
jgi:phosphonate transport system ATP-binding protein